MGMAEALYNIRGSQIDGQDLSTIRDLIRENKSLGRAAILGILCVSSALGTIQWSAERLRPPGLAVGLGEQGSHQASCAAQGKGVV